MVLSAEHIISAKLRLNPDQLPEEPQKIVHLGLGNTALMTMGPEIEVTSQAIGPFWRIDPSAIGRDIVTYRMINHELKQQRGEWTKDGFNISYEGVNPVKKALTLAKILLGRPR